MLPSLFFPTHQSASPIVKVTHQKFRGLKSLVQIGDREISWIRKCDVVLRILHHDILITEAGGVVDDVEYLSALRLMAPAQMAERLKITEGTLLRLEAIARIKLVPYVSRMDLADGWLSNNGEKVRDFFPVKSLYEVKPKELLLGSGVVWSSTAGSDNLELMRTFLEAWTLPIPFQDVVVEQEVFTVREEPRTVCTL